MTEIYPHQRFGINQLLKSGFNKKVTDQLADYPKVGFISFSTGRFHSHYALVREMVAAQGRPVIVVAPNGMHEAYKRDIEGADKNIYISTRSFQLAKSRPLIDHALLDFRYIQSQSKMFYCMRDAIIEAETATALFNIGAVKNLNAMQLSKELKLPMFGLYADAEVTLQRIEESHNDYGY